MFKIGHAGMVLLGVLFLSACGSSSVTPSPTETTPVTPAPTPAPTTPVLTSTIGAGSTSVRGFVSSSNAGAPVQATLITVRDGSGAVVGQGVSDSKGAFTLNVAPGRYSLDFQKSGYAASSVVDYPVLGAGQQLDVVQKMAFSVAMTTKVPTLDIKAVQGASEVAFPNTPDRALAFNASEGLPLHVVARSAGEDVSPKYIYMAVGRENVPGSGFMGSRYFEQNDPKNSVYDKTVSLAAGALRGQTGDTYLNVVVYDNNDNRVNQYIPVHLNDDQPVNTPLGTFLSAKATAVTLAQKIGFASLHPQGASAELSSMWVDIHFDYQAGLQGDLLGYRVFTSDDNKSYRLLKTLPKSVLMARDSSPSLEADKTTYYYIQAYTSTQNVNSPVMSTTPLDSFTLTAMGPANHSRNVSVRPLLTWDVDKKVGDYRKFYVSVNDYPSQGDGCFWGDMNCGVTDPNYNNVYTDDGKTPALKSDATRYSVQFNENGRALKTSLESGHSYSLDVSAAAYRNDGSAISIAQDYHGIFYGLGGCNFGGSVCEGLISTFSTGDGSF